ncbi:MAG: transglutaminase-like domain-containing protein, partial [Planctomycetota bacterium]|nr:transglutaminase-like domain-containing protein [Planctomycetota bacterium]
RPGRVVRDGGVDPIVLDDLVFLPGLDRLAPGDTVRVVVEAPPVRAPRRSAIPSAERIEAVLARFDESDRAALGRTIDQADHNADQLLLALESVPERHRRSLVHLIANLPSRDAHELPASFLLEQVALAHESFAGSPWREGVSDEIFLEAVLPHAHIDERRDDWRRDFTERFREPAWEAPTQREAVRRLNTTVFETFGIQFDANKRLTNEQSPYQTIVQRCASCTGMSIMLANACRAAGIPARLAGIPEWPDGDNHTWVEVFDPIDGRWHWIEAFGRGDYDEGWWVEKVRRLARSPSEDPRFRPWAVGWRRAEGVPDRFHLWWLTEDDDPIPAVDRSTAYARDPSIP